MFARISIFVLVGFLLVALGAVLEANAQTNKEIVQRVADEVLSQGNLAVADELFAADFVNHDPNPGGPDAERLCCLLEEPVQSAAPVRDFTTFVQNRPACCLQECSRGRHG